MYFGYSMSIVHHLSNDRACLIPPVNCDGKHLTCNKTEELASAVNFYLARLCQSLLESDGSDIGAIAVLKDHLHQAGKCLPLYNGIDENVVKRSQSYSSCGFVHVSLQKRQIVTVPLIQRDVSQNTCLPSASRENHITPLSIVDQFTHQKYPGAQYRPCPLELYPS